MSKHWLEKSSIKFEFIAVERDAHRAKLLEFLKTLRHECEDRELYEA